MPPDKPIPGSPMDWLARAKESLALAKQPRPIALRRHHNRHSYFTTPPFRKIRFGFMAACFICAQ
jgi:hypothetical protein